MTEQQTGSAEKEGPICRFFIELVPLLWYDKKVYYKQEGPYYGERKETGISRSWPLECLQ